MSSVEQSSLTPDTMLDASNTLVPYDPGNGISGSIAAFAENYSSWSELHPVYATTVETLGLAALKTAISYVGLKSEVKLTNGHSKVHEEIYESHPLRSLASLVLVGPAAEELVFRVAAPKVISKVVGSSSNSRDRISEQASVALFAAGHVGNPFTEKGRHNLAIPITPLIGGEYYSYLARRRGIKHSIYAHMLNNAFAIATYIPTYLSKKKS